MNGQTTANQDNTTQTPPMKIDVTIGLLKQKTNVLALATVRFNDCFAVNGLRVMTGQYGLFVSMPSMKKSTGEYDSIAHATTADFHEQIQKAVLDKYKSVEKTRGKPSLVDEIKESAEKIKSQPNTAPAKAKNMAIGE